MPKVIIAGNWKMHKTQSEALEFVDRFLEELSGTSADRDIVLCCPFTLLGMMSTLLRTTRVKVGAQNVHWAVSGAYTGEISAPMLVDLGVQYVIVGHSERRQYFGESDATVNLRLRAAQHNGLIPILCIGENKQQRDTHRTKTLLKCQLDRDLVEADLQQLVIAYEPVWAIGTGASCDPVEANHIIGFIRSQLSHADISILYGGSVKPDNIDAIMAQPNVDGVLVGGASLNANDFARIVNYSLNGNMKP